MIASFLIWCCDVSLLGAIIPLLFASDIIHQIATHYHYHYYYSQCYRHSILILILSLLLYFSIGSRCHILDWRQHGYVSHWFFARFIVLIVTVIQWYHSRIVVSSFVANHSFKLGNWSLEKPVWTRTTLTWWSTCMRPKCTSSKLRLILEEIFNLNTPNYAIIFQVEVS